MKDVMKALDRMTKKIFSYNPKRKKGESVIKEVKLKKRNKK